MPLLLVAAEVRVALAQSAGEQDLPLGLRLLQLGSLHSGQQPSQSQPNNGTFRFIRKTGTLKLRKVAKSFKIVHCVLHS